MAKTKGAKTVKPEDAERYIELLLDGFREGMSVPQVIKEHELNISENWFYSKRHKVEGLSDRWDEAKQFGLDLLADDIHRMHTDLLEELSETKKIKIEGVDVEVPKLDPKIAAAKVQAVKNAAHDMKWYLGQRKPDRWGTKVQVDAGGGNVSFTMDLTQNSNDGS